LKEVLRRLASLLVACWTNVDKSDWWRSYPKWRETHNYAELGGNSGVGCVSLQTVNPYIVYANGGGVWRNKEP